MRQRIVQLTVTAAVLAVSLFGLPLAAAVGQYAQANELRDLERVAEASALSVAADLVQDHGPDHLPDKADDVDLALYDTSGDLILGTGPVASDAHVRQAADAQVSAGEQGQDLVVAVPVTHDGDVIGVVRAATRGGAVDRIIWLAWLVMGLLAGAAIAAVYGVARRQARMIARPLEELSMVARRLGDGDFSVRASAAAIPEIDSVGDSLNSTAKRLGDLVQRERSFSADASHQLRTPLAGLRLQIEAAINNPSGDSPKSLRPAIAAVDRLEQTVNDLLVLARDARPNNGPTDVRKVIDEVAGDWRRHPSVGRRKLRVEIAPDTPPCLAAESAVRQVLTVLLDNAAVHGEGTATLTARDAGGVLAIDVTDEGPGISKPESELFVRRGKVATGHGIGLALARSLAEAEGGRLRLTTALPATFTLLLPEAPTLMDYN